MIAVLQWFDPIMGCRSAFMAALLAVIFVVISGDLAYAQSESSGEADRGAMLFMQNCAGCHAIGGDAQLSGPNLAPTIMWDPADLEIEVVRMQKFTKPMTPEQVEDLIELLRDPKSAERLKSEKDRKAGKPTAGAATVSKPSDAQAEPAESKSTPTSENAANWMIDQAELSKKKAEQTSDSASSASARSDDEGAMLFMQNCAGCHSIGGDAKLIGPNLAATVTWPAADLEAAVKRMEKYAGPMSQDHVQSLVSLLHDAKAGERIKGEQERKIRKQTASMEKPSARRGAQLFHGDVAFANGGLACISCHSAGSRGGSMGPALTDSFKKLGATALQSACEQANFKVMSAAYRDHKVTTQEALHLTEYLKTVSEDLPQRSSANVPLFGATGAAMFLGVIRFLFRKRNGGPVCRKLVRRH